MTETTAVEHIDPVCGMTVDPADAAGSFEYRGTTYYFCNPTCLERFAAAPAEFVTEQGEVKPAEPMVVAGATYVCPMHPEVEQSEPGACPKCGMALEPRIVSLEDRPNPELIDMTRRFWIAVALGAPVFLLTMADMLLGGE